MKNPALAISGILIEASESRPDVLAELKYAESGAKMEKDCDTAL